MTAAFKAIAFDSRDEYLTDLLVYGFIHDLTTKYGLNSKYIIPQIISTISYNYYYQKYHDSLLLILSSKEIRKAMINRSSNEGQNKLLYDKQEWIGGHRVVYCLGRNISYNLAKNIGFNKPNTINNQIIFKCAKNENISAFNIDSNECITFENIFIDHQRTPMIFSDKYGLILVGGQKGSEPILDIKQCIFTNNKNNKMVSIANLPVPTTWSSLCFIEEDKLCICGGWWLDRDSKLCYMLDLNTNTLINIKTMNFKHQLGGIYHWKERNKLIMSGGFNSRRECEEYDIGKDIWIPLPSLGKPHNRYPCLTQLNEFGEQVIVCIGGVSMDDKGLGYIEILDYREDNLKWKYVDTVQHYFNLPYVNGGGYNCFLPF